MCGVRDIDGGDRGLSLVDIQFLGFVAQRACCLSQDVNSCTVTHLSSIKGCCYTWRYDIYQAVTCSFWLGGATGTAVGTSSWTTDRSAAAAAAGWFKLHSCRWWCGFVKRLLLSCCLDRVAFCNTLLKSSLHGINAAHPPTSTRLALGEEEVLVLCICHYYHGIITINAINKLPYSSILQTYFVATHFERLIWTLRPYFKVIVPFSLWYEDSLQNTDKHICIRISRLLHIHIFL